MTPNMNGVSFWFLVSSKPKLLPLSSFLLPVKSAFACPELVEGREAGYFLGQKKGASSSTRLF